MKMVMTQDYALKLPIGVQLRRAARRCGVPLRVSDSEILATSRNPVEIVGAIDRLSSSGKLQLVEQFKRTRLVPILEKAIAEAAIVWQKFSAGTSPFPETEREMEKRAANIGLSVDQVYAPLRATEKLLEWHFGIHGRYGERFFTPLRILLVMGLSPVEIIEFFKTIATSQKKARMEVAVLLDPTAALLIIGNAQKVLDIIKRVAEKPERIILGPMYHFNGERFYMRALLTLERKGLSGDQIAENMLAALSTSYLEGILQIIKDQDPIEVGGYYFIEKRLFQRPISTR